MVYCYLTLITDGSPDKTLVKQPTPFGTVTKVKVFFFRYIQVHKILF